MVRIFYKDGTYKDLSKDEVTVIKFDSDNFYKMDNYNNGVNVYFKDGNVEYINNAECNRDSITFNTLI